MVRDRTSRCFGRPGNNCNRGSLVLLFSDVAPCRQVGRGPLANLYSRASPRVATRHAKVRALRVVRTLVFAAFALVRTPWTHVTLPAAPESDRWTLPAAP